MKSKGFAIGVTPLTVSFIGLVIIFYGCDSAPRNDVHEAKAISPASPRATTEGLPPELQYVSPDDAIRNLPVDRQRELFRMRKQSALALIKDQLGLAGAAPSSIVLDGELAIIGVERQATADMVQAMICRGQWPGKYGQINFRNTMLVLRRAGVVKITIACPDVRDTTFMTNAEGACVN